MKWQAEAPTNIALIKYMGKQPSAHNVPANASLSFTLGHLKSFVELEWRKDLQADSWEALPLSDPLLAPALTEQGQARFIKHLVFLKKIFKT